MFINNIKKILSVFTFLILLFALSTAYAADRWQWITSTDDTTYSYDTTSIKGSYDNSYLVWLRLDYTEEEGQRQMKAFNYSEPSSYSLAQFEFDYKHTRTRLVSHYVYSNAGKMISSNDYSYANWKTIAPDTIMEHVYMVTYDAFKKIQKKSWQDFLPN